MDHLDAPKNGFAPNSWPLALPLSARPLLRPRPSNVGFELKEPGEAKRTALWSTMLRSLRRYWWQVALLWLIGSAALMYWIHIQVKPSYEAFALLQVEPPVPAVFGSTETQSLRAGEDHMETQVQLITSPNVLGAALQDNEMAMLPKIRQSLDPESELRQELQSIILPKTNLIQVRMSALNPGEAATIVNAVVDAYLVSTRLRAERRSRDLKQEFESLREKLEQEVKSRKDQLLRLANEASLAAADSPLGDAETRVRSPEELRINEVTIEEYKGLSQQLIALEDKIWLAEGDLARQRAERPLESSTAPSEADLESQISKALQNDPELTALRRALHEAEASYRIVQSRTRKPSDPSRVQAQQRIDGLRRNYQELSQWRADALRNQLAREQAAPQQQGQGTFDETIRQMEIDLQRLQAQRERLVERLQELRIQGRDDRIEALEQEFTRVDYNIAQEKLKKVTQLLEQLNFEIQRNRPQISLMAPARSVKQATSNKRIKYLALAPVGVLVIVLGLFTLLENQAARVANPDDLPGRVQIGVIGVVPPLPTARGLLGRNSPAKLQRRVEEFVQSLDHLRVILCSSARADATAAEGRRVVLITSACGSEGKTTLAAQLAGRCANAGLSTLLVDADLRRPRLADLLEVPNGLGLADVLAGDAEPEAAMVVIGSAGGFHLLPAGSPGHDPSRLLEGDRLGQLMAQLRVTFDVVIIDAPPVLAVPDALLIGRWVDGAVLAVRHDASRFPLVKRANRCLANIGIPVFGAVVNGARSPDMAYGSYGQNYSYSYAQNSGDNS